MKKNCTSKLHVGNRELDVDNFRVKVSAKDGRHSWCIECLRKYNAIHQAKWYKANKETHQARMRKYCYSEQKKDNRKTILATPEKMIALRLYELKHRCKRRGIEFDLKIEDFIGKVPTHCPILGIELTTGGGMRQESTITFDRINPRGGYTKDNVIIVSWRANRIKNDGTPDEHKKIYDFYSKYK